MRKPSLAPTATGVAMVVALAVTAPVGAAMADDTTTEPDTTSLVAPDTTESTTDTNPTPDQSAEQTSTEPSNEAPASNDTPATENLVVEQNAPEPQPVAPAAKQAPQQLNAPAPVAPVVDTQKPVASLAPAPSIFNSANVDLVVSATDETELVKVVGNIRNAAGAIVLPAQTAASGTSGELVIDLSSLGDGKYNLRYNALDLAGNVAPTQSFDFTVDNKAPVVTVKPESIGSDGLFRNVSFKLNDGGKVDKVVLNGVTKDLSNNVWSDLNGVKPGTFGAVEGQNTLEVYDVAGNVTIVVFTLDTTGPTATVKPESKGGEEGFYREVSFKLFDKAKVVKATLNGVEKPLSPNQWSDLNGIKPGTFGAVEGLNTLVLEDALGNQSTHTFTLDTIKPVVIVPSTVEWVSGTHTWNLTQTEANPLKAYVEIQQLVDGKWKKFAGTWYNETNAFDATFDTTALTSNVRTQIKISTWDKAGNQSGASFEIKIDNTAPTITVKPESIGSDGVYSNASFKLFDSLSGVDKVFVNGVEKNLTDNKWSDLNGLKPGKFGAVEGVNTIVVQDVAGNTTTLEITLDATAPEVVDESHEWQTKGGGRDSITLTFSEPVTGLGQGWYGSGTTWTKAYHNTKTTTITFVDAAGNSGEYTLTPNGAPIVEPEPETPSSNPDNGNNGSNTTPTGTTPSNENPSSNPPANTGNGGDELASTGAGDGWKATGLAGLVALVIGSLLKFFGKFSFGH